MSFLLPCPHCGPRPAEEYAYFGEVTSRPTRVDGNGGHPSLRELADYVYFRDNVAGPQQEWWQHRSGCGEWFLARRDTRTNEILEISLPEPAGRGRAGLAGPDPSGGAERVPPKETRPLGERRDVAR